MADYDKKRLQLEIDKRKKIEKKLKQRLIFEKTVSTVSSRFIAVKNINTAINYTLRNIGRLSGASRAYLFLFSKDGKTMSNTHEWCRKGVFPQIKNLQNIPSNSLPWWVAQLRRGNTIHITDVSKMPKAAKATQKLLESQDIKSLLVIPLYIGGKLVGFAGFDDVANAGEWNDDDLMLLRICSEIVGKALESKRSDDKLKESEKQFRVLAEENPSMIYIHNFKSIVYANQKAAEVMGYTREQGYSKNFDFMNLVVPEFRPDIRKFIIKNMEGKDIEPFECVLITQKGKRLDVIMTTKLIQYRGKPASLGMVTDITERKKAEAKIKGYAKELETKVEERTKELSAKIEDLERFHDLAVGRELKMIELKGQIKKLQKKLSEKKHD
ncbi:MAG: PAS domain S-box protein [Nanoarchaeota archaeon]|nr:PAS domain S-box protein [Nanoarchaeota archaeon]